jgi:hypothetical protein
MITGYDSVVIAKSPAGPGVRAMVDGLHARWPDMVVALGGKDAESIGPFMPWRQARAAVPAEAGELYVARDAAMERAWDDVGYSLMEGGEGPFAVLYRPAPKRTVAIQLDEEPYGWEGFRFEPYEATLVSAGLSLVTIVTPDEESFFSRDLRGLLTHELIAQAQR